VSLAAALPLRSGRLAVLFSVLLLAACAGKTAPEPQQAPAPEIVTPAPAPMTVAPPAPALRFAGHVASYKTLAEAEAAWPRLAERYPAIREASRRYVEVDLGGGKCCLRRLDFGLGLEQRRLCCFEFDLGGAAADEALIAVEIAFSARHAGLRLGDCRLGLLDGGDIGRILDLVEKVALLDLAAFFKGDLADKAAYLRPDIGCLKCLGAAGKDRRDRETGFFQGDHADGRGLLCCARTGIAGGLAGIVAAGGEQCAERQGRGEEEGTPYHSEFPVRWQSAFNPQARPGRTQAYISVRIDLASNAIIRI